MIQKRFDELSFCFFNLHCPKFDVKKILSKFQTVTACWRPAGGRFPNRRVAAGTRTYKVVSVFSCRGFCAKVPDACSSVFFKHLFSFFRQSGSFSWVPVCFVILDFVVRWTEKCATGSVYWVELKLEAQSPNWADCHTCHN